MDILFALATSPTSNPSIGSPKTLNILPNVSLPTGTSIGFSVEITSIPLLSPSVGPIDQAEAKLAVECGYFPLFRFDPRLKAEGKNPFQLDSKTPNWERYNEFLMNETRYASLAQINPDNAQSLLEANVEHAKERFENYVKMANQQ